MPFTASIGPLELLILLIIGILVIVFLLAKRRPAGLQVDNMRGPVKGATTKRLTRDERSEALTAAVNSALARGYRVESQTDIQAIVVSGKPVNHILHLLLSLFTVGIWVLVWIGLAISGGEKRELISVDEYGNTSYSKM